VCWRFWWFDIRQWVLDNVLRWCKYKVNLRDTKSYINGQLRTLMHQHETCTLHRQRLSSEKPSLVMCWFNYCFEFEPQISQSPLLSLFATPTIPSLRTRLSHHAFFPPVHIGCKTCHVLISTNSLLHCDSKVRIVCGSAVEALPDHLWSSCIVTILLLTNLQVVL
jgi:hypothetical protein